MRIRMRLVGHLSAVGIAAAIAGSAGAAPIAVGIGAFDDPTADINFTGIGVSTVITNQFAGQGVTFSGGLYGFAGGNSAANFDVAFSNPGTAITIDFSQTMLRAGFNVSSQSAADLQVGVSAYSGDVLVSTGTVNFVTGLTTSFVGVEDLTDGIDRLVLTPVGGGGRLILDNVVFDAAAAVVPEPSAALLFPTGLLLAAHGLRRRRVRA